MKCLFLSLLLLVVAGVNSTAAMDCKFLDFCKRLFSGRSEKTVTVDGAKFSIAPQHGVVADVFSCADGHNYLSPRLGGLSFSVGEQGTASAKVTRKRKNGFEFKGSISNDATLHGRLVLENGRLRGTYTVSCYEKDVSEQRCLAIGLNLGNESNVCWRGLDGEWRECTVPPQERSGVFRIQPLRGVKRSRLIEIASPKTGRAMSLQFPFNIPNVMSIEVYPETGEVLFNAYLVMEMPAPFIESLSVSMKPHENVEGLPMSIPFVKSDCAEKAPVNENNDK